MRLLAWLLLFPLISPAAGDQWIRLKTPHFEMYTSAGEGKGREAILYFEQVRSFFLQMSPSKHAPDFPVRIIAFRGEKQYQPYRINESAIAYYTGSHDRDYIVMQDVSSEHYPVAIHEYVHLIVRHSGLKLPVWMNEGWAELYSTLKPVGNKARVGDLKPGWLQTLAMEKWLPLQTLTTVDHNSPLYNEKNKSGVFYAESWAMMHMLYFDDHYRPHFNAFVAALAGGKSFDEASQAVYSMSLAQVEKDLKSYFTMHKLYAATVDVKLTKSEEEAAVSPLSEFDSQLALAGLLVVTRKTDRAKEALTVLAAQHPERPEVEESLGYLAWQTGDNEGARVHFAKAIAAGTENAQLCYHYALMEHSDKSLDAFRRAVNLKPDFTDARMQLGLALMNRHDYEGAFAAFTHINRVTAEEASRLFSAKAYALLKMGKLEDARRNAEDAKKWAKTPGETEQASSILRYLDGVEASKKSGMPVTAAGPRGGVIPVLEETSPIETTTVERAPRLVRRDAPPQQETPPAPPIPREVLARIEGTAQQLDCNGKQARISVLTDRGVMKFEIADPGRVKIKHSSENAHDFACGPQASYKIAVEYVPAPDLVRGSRGSCGCWSFESLMAGAELKLRRSLKAALPIRTRLCRPIGSGATR